MPSSAGSVLCCTRDSCSRMLVTDLYSRTLVHSGEAVRPAGRMSLLGWRVDQVDPSWGCELHPSDRSTVAGQKIHQKMHERKIEAYANGALFVYT